MCDSAPERDCPSTRRRLLKVTGAAAIAAAIAPNARGGEPQPSPATKPANRPNGRIQIGILLGTFARPTLEARLDAAKACGIACAQLSMDCAALPAMPDAIPPELIERSRREFAAREIAIASLQGTFNMSHPDAQQRQAGLRRLKVLADACKGLGTSKIHLCTGTRDRQNMWRRHADNDSPQAWRDMVDCMGKAVEIAEEAQVLLAFEPEVNNVVDSAKKARRLLDEIRSKCLKVTIDPANIFHAGELPHMARMLDEAFELLGKDIALAHAKDLDHDGDAGHLAAGKGRLDYDRYLRLLASCGFDGPLLLHGLSETQAPGCVAFLREKLARLTPKSSSPDARPM